MTGDGTVGVVLLAVVLLLVGVGVCDAVRGPLSWREWWDRLR
jgi:hypothetical protein